MTNARAQTGYADVNGVHLYYEIHGTGKPLILLHGGLGFTSMFGPLLPQLAEKRKVIAVDLQAHGRTADIDRPIRCELMGDDIVALIKHLGFQKADVMGYSLGGGVALRTAIQHPEVVDRLVLVSVPYSRNGWYPEIRQSMSQMGASAFEFMKATPMYQGYAAVAPKPGNFPALLDKMGELLRQEYDWSREVAALKIPVLLVYADADSVIPLHAVEFFQLLGGGQRDAGWDGSGMSSARLAILPGLTHYNVFMSPLLAQMVTPFLDAPAEVARKFAGT
ncbi:alpha/beta fold hydrolase [Vitiosangium sp. GDMCC 1.1324]|uniref:alpha/beta fold hydrolase n=1 Tax=Vitiosangium sp. (strain GDMCC 1.1324) TaxID=2138576 RepID=UPI000D34060C|nr:alpha/beta hydrolase [Vitiosangium sp. GDMCC 1.1324]PTL82237.1 alpha/beta hydrolase [Vitiosangium sp. GDMCC 1.1324]